MIHAILMFSGVKNTSQITIEKMTDKRILAVLVLISQIFAVPVFGGPSLSKAATCITQSCKFTATSLLLSMNKDAHPCVDFFEYACGNWRNNNPMPSNNYNWDQFSIKMLEMENEIVDILKIPITSNDIVAVQKAKLSYRTCMDEGKIDNRGSEGIEAILNSNGGWPLMMCVGTWIEGEFPWQIINNNYMTYFGVFGLFNLDIASDEVETSRYRITLAKPDQFRLPLEKMMFFNDNEHLMKCYSSYISNTVQAMDDFKKEAGFRERLLKNVRDIINFEIRLAEITAGLNDVVRSVPYLITINELQKMHNSANPSKSTFTINWLHTIKSIFTALPDIKIDGNEQILLEDEIFFERLVDLLDETPEEIIVNYIHWKLMDSATMYTSREIRENLMELYRCHGLEYPKTREQICQEETGMEHAIGYAYMKRHYSDTAIMKIRNIKTRIQKAMADKIDGSWLDDNTKFLAKDKLNNIVSLIGYPDWYTDEGVNTYYEDFEVGLSLTCNWLNRQYFKLNHKRQLLRTLGNRERWQIPPTTFNAYYSSTTNTILIPASLLQLPFFDADRPDVFNYAAIGAIIGHEITHGFDMKGCQYDKDGNKNQWWDNDAVEEYKSRAQCFVAKFNKYIVYRSPDETIHVNGVRTLNENIADAVGYELAYAAYKQSDEEERNSDFVLEGLESYTKDQIFYITLANLGCSSESNEYLKFIEPESKHSPSSVRVNGALSNMASFGRDFHCLTGLPMSPIEKCQIWI